MRYLINRIVKDYKEDLAFRLTIYASPFIGIIVHIITD